MSPSPRARLISPALPLALALAGCGGPLLSAEVEVQRFCVKQTNVFGSIPPNPAAVTLGPPLLPTVPFDVTLPPMLRTHGSTVVLKVLDATLLASPSSAGLQNIHDLHVDILAPVSGTAVPVLDYARTGAPAAATQASIPLGGHGLDLVGLLQGTQLQLQFSGTTDGPVPVPQTSWQADLEVCLYGKTVISYL
jgi:hypothetical protein